MSPIDPARLRLSDAERDAAAHDLGEHFAQGRLTQEEHAERLEAIWSAKTRGELPPLFADLPSPWAAPVVPPPRSGVPGVRSGPHVLATRHGLPTWVVVLLVIVGLVAIAEVWPLVLVVLAVWFFLVRRTRRSLPPHQDWAHRHSHRH